ncbi:hypothetical protein OG912_00505 [Streptomyces sp. NBC_00464]|uniref:hypothetical protein n=1 Tax=Streptomyces sp. NBC_00464 TaxID=2975751 RepID=UPI002E190180
MAMARCLLGNDELFGRIQYLAHPGPGDGPLLPVPLGHGQLGLLAVGFFPQLVHPTTGSKLTLFQQPHDRRHP